MSMVSNLLKRERGVTRQVLLIGRLAFKFPALYSWRLLLLGLLANMQEARFARAGWPELCPVLFAIPGGFLVVMRRARLMTDAEFDAFDVPTWAERGDYIVPVEHKSDSFGWLDGRIVAIDYGN